MPIVQNIPRKQGRIVAPPKNPLVRARIFGPAGTPGAAVGNAQNPSDPALYKAAGVDYNQVSSTGGATNPVGTSRNTATQMFVPQSSPYGQAHQINQRYLPEVGPQEHGTFFSPQPQKDVGYRVSGGVDDNANTPFHPKTTPTTRPRRYPSHAGERTNAASFVSSGYLTGNPTRDSEIHAALGGPVVARTRWGAVKKSASDAPAPKPFTTPHVGAQESGAAVGSGTTGKVATGTAANINTPVADNAHSGSPHVVPWVPNRRGAQPSERGNTNPVKQKCVKGTTQGPCGLTW